MKKRILSGFLACVMLLSLLPTMALAAGSESVPYAVADLQDGDIVNGTEWIDFTSGSYGLNIYDSEDNYVGDSDTPLEKIQIIGVPDSEQPTSEDYIERGFLNPIDFRVDTSLMGYGWLNLYALRQVETDLKELPVAEDESITLSLRCRACIAGQTVTLQLYEEGAAVSGASVQFTAESGAVEKTIAVAGGILENKHYTVTATVGFAAPYVETIAAFCDSDLNSWANSKYWDFDWYADPAAEKFTISDEEQFAAFAAIVNGDAKTLGFAQTDFDGKTVKLAADLNLTEKAWKPIGNGWSSFDLYAEETADTLLATVDGSGWFSGTFDGDNHTVSYQITEEDSYFSECGLFGYVKGGNVGNLVVNVTASFPSTYTTNEFDLDGQFREVSVYIGGLAVYASNAHIYGIVVNGTINNRSFAAQGAGVVFYAGGVTTLENCVNNADIHIGQYYRTTTSNQYAIAGGIVCQTSDNINDKIVFDNCINHGDIEIENPFDNPSLKTWDGYGSGKSGDKYSMKLNAGGLVGQISGGSNYPYVVVGRNCYSDGEIIGSSIEKFSNGAYVSRHPSSTGSFVGKMWEYNEGDPQKAEYTVSKTDKNNEAFYPNDRLFLVDQIDPDSFDITDYVTFKKSGSSYTTDTIADNYFYRASGYNSSVVYHTSSGNVEVTAEQLAKLNESCALLGTVVYLDVCINQLPEKTSDLVITLDANGGTLEGGNTFTVSADGKYPTLPTPSKDHAQFLGWYGTADWTDSRFKVSSGQDVNVCEDATLVAMWKEEVAQIGDTIYESLAEAVAAVPTNGMKTKITLLTDITAESDSAYVTINGGRNVELDMNGHTIAISSMNAGPFAVDGGSLELSGEGKVENTYYTGNVSDDGWYVVRMYSAPESQKNYSVFTQGKDVELAGVYTVVHIQHLSNTEYNYGSVVNLNGECNSKGKIVYVAGTEHNTDNAPIINFGATSESNAVGTEECVYIAGYGVVNVADGAKLTAAENCIVIAAGELNINGGTFTGGNTIGVDEGTRGSIDLETCCSVFVKQHSTNLPLAVNITGGTFTSAIPFRQAVGQADTPQPEKVTLEISGGKFLSTATENRNAVKSDDKTGFITGGLFSNEVPASYLAAGYVCAANIDSETKTAYPWTVVKSADVSGVSMTQESYTYGEAVAYQGTPAATIGGVPTAISSWTYTYYKNKGTAQAPEKGDSLAAAPSAVGSYVLVVAASSTEFGGEQIIPFTISKKALSITADDKSAIVGEAMPTLTYTVSGLVGSDKLTTEPILSCTPNMNAAGSYEITVSGGTASDNYTITARTSGRLTVLKASQSAPVKGEGYTISGSTLTAAVGYELYNGETINTGFTIENGKTYFVRKAENTGCFASAYTAIDTTVSVAAIASPASMGTVSISGVTDGKCSIGASVTATATAKDGYEFVKWVSGSEEKTENPYTFTATVGTTLTAVFKVKDKVVAVLPTVNNSVYTGSLITGVTGNNTCTLVGTTSAVSAGTYTATAKLAAGYDVWPDGTTADKTIVWSISPKTQEPPQNLSAEGLLISPVTDAMEYKLSTDAAYQPVPTDATSVEVPSAGTYYVRMKATDNALASKITVVVVKEPTISAVTVSPANLDTTSALFTGAAEPYSDSRIIKVGFEYRTNTGRWIPAEAAQNETFSILIDTLTPDTDYTVRAFVTYTTEGEEQPTTAYGRQIVFHTRKAADPSVTLGEITVGAAVEGAAAKKVIISVEEGNDVIASAISEEAISAGSTFKATFDNLPDGIYNVVVRTEDGDFTETRMVTIENGAAVDTMFTIPVGKMATVVEVKSEDTPKLSVEGLAEMLTDTDKNAAAVGAQNVEIKLEAQKESTAASESAQPDTTQYAVAQIKKLLPEASAAVEEKIETVLDLSLIKTTTELENDEIRSVEVKDIGSENNTVIEVAIPYVTKGKTLKVYRYHDDAAEELSILSSRPSAGFIDGTYFVGDGYVFLYASGFSTYAISSEQEKTIYIGGDGDTTTYTITFADTANGKVSVDRKNAPVGSTVTITVTPDTGFTLETLTVTDKNGKDVALKNLGSNKFSFTMPDGEVTVSATFMEDNTMLNFFVDVKADDYFYDAVLWAAEKGITKGVDSTHFGPDVGTTRGQVVTFLWRAAGCPEPTGTAEKFTDLKPNEYYQKAIAWAIEQKITKGTSATTFSPDQVCTRAQIVTFLARFAGVADEAAGYTHGFTDVRATDYFNNAVAWAKDNGVTDGVSAELFGPDQPCTRAQTVTFLYRWMVR